MTRFCQVIWKQPLVRELQIDLQLCRNPNYRWLYLATEDASGAIHMFRWVQRLARLAAEFSRQGVGIFWDLPSGRGGLGEANGHGRLNGLQQQVVQQQNVFAQAQLQLALHRNQFRHTFRHQFPRHLLSPVVCKSHEVHRSEKLYTA